MGILGNNGFIRKQEIAFARKLLVWQCEKSGSVLPDNAALSARAEKVVEEAHRIAKQTGSNVWEILKKIKAEK